MARLHGGERNVEAPALKTSRQPARPRLILRHHRPVVLGFAMRDRADQPVAPDIPTRKWHADRAAGFEREIGVLQAENGALAGRKIALVRR